MNWTTISYYFCARMGLFLGTASSEEKLSAAPPRGILLLPTFFLFRVYENFFPKIYQRNCTISFGEVVRVFYGAEACLAKNGQVLIPPRTSRKPPGLAFSKSRRLPPGTFPQAERTGRVFFCGRRAGRLSSAHHKHAPVLPVSLFPFFPEGGVLCPIHEVVGI